jgi:hypothetical protein
MRKNASCAGINILDGGFLRVPELNLTVPYISPMLLSVIHCHLKTRGIGRGASGIHDFGRGNEIREGQV